MELTLTPDKFNTKTWVSIPCEWVNTNEASDYSLVQVRVLCLVRVYVPFKDLRLEYIKIFD